MKVLAISGSLRKGSYNTALAMEALTLLSADADTKLADISQLPLYNQDEDADTKPQAVQELLSAVASADALIVVTPEYNYSVSGALKNAIDWLSRPAYKSVLAHKPTLVMSASMSPMGGVRAQGHLKQILAGTLTPVFSAPEFAVGTAQDKFSEGRLSDADTQKKLARLVSDFSQWLSTVK